jgi:hypothetical protein
MMKSSAPPHSPETSAGPNARAGLKPAPVSGPAIITSPPSVPPMTSAAQPRSLRGFTATPTIAHTRKNVPRSSTENPPQNTSPPIRSLMLTAPKLTESAFG